jgi:hypothetical protein
LHSGVLTADAGIGLGKARLLYPFIAPAFAPKEEAKINQTGNLYRREEARPLVP